MVRKAVFTREDVVRAALSVVEKGQLGQLSARRVAEELGSSTAPVYSNFQNMEELTAAVKTAIAEQMLELAHEPRTTNEFLNMGLGVLEFARRKPGLYSAIFLHGADDAVGRYVMESLLRRMERVPDLAGLPAVERVILLRKMAIFTHGLATQLCSGMAEHVRWDEIVALLEEVGAAMVADAAQRPARTPEEIALLGAFCQAQPLSHPAAPRRETDPRSGNGES